ncbi:putative beta-1,3-galactosyltransferase 2 [Sesamum alatum]|uniref:Beta-1,3-galactosyltransferase 2 n=1 Tax=Sesamum alatum TaxID=300844 RepID=A0AAE1XZE4_9LAMI|nr:putative beta-1,3-galactosyltransferase 2 [Sesamum alatum]
MENKHSLYRQGSSSRTSIIGNEEEFQEEDVWGSVSRDTKDSDSRPVKSSSFKDPSLIPKRLQTSARMIPKSHKHNPNSQEPKIVHHSAPLNIPDWSKIYGTTSKTMSKNDGGFGRSSWESDDEEKEEDGEDGNVIPPHEWIARKLARNRISSFSVCEGAGRTLKGRDLSRAIPRVPPTFHHVGHLSSCLACDTALIKTFTSDPTATLIYGGFLSMTRDLLLSPSILRIRVKKVGTSWKSRGVESTSRNVVSRKLTIFLCIGCFCAGMLLTDRMWAVPEVKDISQSTGVADVNLKLDSGYWDPKVDVQGQAKVVLGEVSKTHHAIQTLDKTISNLEMELAAARAVQHSLLGGSPVSQNLNMPELGKKRKYLMVVGINTAFSSRKRRDSVRATWMLQGDKRKKLEEEKGIVIRFVIGHSATSGGILDCSLESIEAEDKKHGDFLRLEHVEGYLELSAKTKAFFTTAITLWDADFYVKVDDDVHVNIATLGATLARHRSKPRVYIGCMKSGPVLAQKGVRYHEPEYWKFGEQGNKYFRHATGQIYAISKDLATYISINRHILHKYANEDVSLGSWFIGLDVEHIDDRRLYCEWKAQAGNVCVASFDWSCSGICNSADRMKDVHQRCGEGANALWLRLLTCTFLRNHRSYTSYKDFAMGFLGADVSHLKILDFSIRLLLIPFNLASIWIAVNTRQNNTDYGDLEFADFIGLKYMVGVSAVSAGYALFAAVSSWLRCLVTKAWIFFVADQVLAYLMVTSLASLMEFLYLAYNGDQLVSWSQACASYSKFCSRLKIALALHVIAVCCFLVLAVISAYRVFRRYDPPFLPSKEGEQATTT